MGPLLQELSPPDRCKQSNIWFPLNNLSSSRWISLKFIRRMTISKIQMEVEKGSYALVLAGVISPNAHEKCQLVSIHGWMSLKFMLYMICSKIQVEFEN